MKLKNELFPHQKQIIEKLKKVKVGAIFAEQGTGKTITAMELCRIRMEAGKVDEIIWLCPCSAKQNIKEEIIKQAPAGMLGHVTICGIETLSSSIRVNSYLMGLVENRRCYLIVDESLLVKNPRAYRTKNIDRLSEKCQYKLILNGTPISRNEADMYAQFHILDWRILGYKSYWSFAANHIEYDPNVPNKIRRCLNTDVLAEKVAPFTVEIKKKDCISLPEKKYTSRAFRLTAEQDEHYDYISQVLLEDVDEMKPETIYRLFSGLQAVISGFRVSFRRGEDGYEHIVTNPFFEKPENNPRMKVLMDDINDTEQNIIFCNYRREIDDLCTVLEEKYGMDEVTRFDGTMNMKKRDAGLQKFKGGAKFLVANRGCAGYSLNLQFCRNITYFSNGWDLATRLQSEDRVHRIGQGKEVWITDIYAADTLDERILRCLYRKESLLDSIREEIREMGGRFNFKDWTSCRTGGHMGL